MSSKSSININLPAKAMPFLWFYVKKFRWSFLTLLVCLFLWGLNEALFPYFIKLMVDKIGEVDNRSVISLWDTFYTPIVGIFLTWTIMELAMRVYGFIEVYLFPKFRAAMRGDVFDYVKRQSLDYFTTNLAGSIGAKIADIPRSSYSIVDELLWRVIATSIAFILSIIVVAQVSLIASAVIILWCFLHMGITFYYLEEVNYKVTDHYESLAKLNGETVDIVVNASSMRLFSRFKYETTRLSRYQNLEIHKSQIMGLCFQKINLMRGFVGVCFIFVITYLLLKGWHEGWLTSGDFPLVAMTSFNLLGLIWHMSIALVDLFREVGTLNGALSLLKHQHTVVDRPHAAELIVRKGEIEFQHIKFGYKKTDPLFTGLSIKIASGEKVGFVGFSGSGKTSLINLLLREYDVNDGRICIDGQEISSVSQDSLRKQIAIIPQDPSLFHRSIMENIRYGRPEARDEEVIQASQKAHCHEFIMKLEDGYSTIVGERGLRLSGGQRQRLAIARAILKDAPILVMDEATSALDSATEKAIHESMVVLMRNRTTLIIAHRLSTLKNMDRIIVFDKGKVVEEGSQKQLLRNNSHFAHLWSLQQEGFLPDKDVSAKI